jgi:monofunctional biosynthetic peptidoglycan transglycosylase
MQVRFQSPWPVGLLTVVLLPLGCGAPGGGGGEAETVDRGANEEREVTVTETEGEAGVELRADFSAAGEIAQWGPVDDVVMGGVSSSTVRASDEGTAVFSGEVSLENNGGFASVRSRPRDWELAGMRGLALRVRGDGKSYKLGARTDGAFDGVTWQATFETVAGQWTTVRLAFEDMQPRWRGRQVADAGPLRPETVRTLGLLISDKQEGPFRLEVAWIGGWR